MIKHADSHLDHNLTTEQIEHVMQRFADREAFFIETIELPEVLGTVPCGLHGPLMGDAPIPESEVTHAARGTRAWTSRLTERAPRAVRTITVIAGPHEETCYQCKGACGFGAMHAFSPCMTCECKGKIKHACIVYTMFGGPLAPQEPGDPGCKNVEASSAFWAEHALSR